MESCVDLEKPDLLDLQVAHKLREQITQRQFASNRPLPSYDDLARSFSVSKATVQKAIGRLKSEGLVVTRVGKGTFMRPSAVIAASADAVARDGTRAVRTQKLNLAAIFFDVWGRPEDYLSPLLGGILDLCQKENCNLQLHCIHGATLETEENRLVHQLIYGQAVDGVLILSPINPQDIRSLRRQRIPFVCVGALCPQPANVVTADLEGIIRLYVEECQRRGKSRLALVTGPHQQPQVSAPLVGPILAGHFRRVLERQGLPYVPEWCLAGEYHEEDGRRCVTSLLQQTQVPEAVLVVGDAMTRGAVQALGGRRELLLVSCAERELGLAPVCILQPLRRIGERAAALLIEVMEGRRDPLSGREETLPPILHINEPSPAAGTAETENRDNLIKQAKQP